MALAEHPLATTHSAIHKRAATPEDRRERRIQRLMWTFEVEGIHIKREVAEEAVDIAAARRHLK